MNDDIQATVSDLAELLQSAGEESWARVFHRLLVRLRSASPERQTVVRDILSLYGAAGSFSDLVLQDASGVGPEQRQLDRLRTRLFELARAELR